VKETYIYERLFVCIGLFLCERDLYIRKPIFTKASWCIGEVNVARMNESCHT